MDAPEKSNIPVQGLQGYGNPNSRRESMMIMIGLAVGISCGAFVMVTRAQEKLPHASDEVPEVAAPQAEAESEPVPKPADEIQPGKVQAESARLQALQTRQKRDNERRALEDELGYPSTPRPRTRRPRNTGAPINLPTTQAKKPSATGPIGPKAINARDTLSYWNALNSIIDHEAAKRAAPRGGIRDGNAAAFLENRMEAAQYAVRKLKELDNSGVDHEAMVVRDVLLSWYQEALAVSTQGRNLMRQGTEVRQGAAGQKWQAAEKKHSAAVTRVNQIGERIRQSLSERYGVAFPKLH